MTRLSLISHEFLHILARDHFILLLLLFETSCQQTFHSPKIVFKIRIKTNFFHQVLQRQYNLLLTGHDNACPIDNDIRLTDF